MSRDRLPTGFVSRHPFWYMISILQCLQLVRIHPYLYGFCVVCTDIRELCSIIRKSARVDLKVSYDQRIFDLCPRAVPGKVWRATLVRVSVTVSLRS